MFALFVTFLYATKSVIVAAMDHFIDSMKEICKTGRYCWIIHVHSRGSVHLLERRRKRNIKGGQTWHAVKYQTHVLV